jgi:hypothetical protein
MAILRPGRCSVHDNCFLCLSQRDRDTKNWAVNIESIEFIASRKSLPLKNYRCSYLSTCMYLKHVVHTVLYNNVSAQSIYPDLDPLDIYLIVC